MHSNFAPLTRRQSAALLRAAAYAGAVSLGTLSFLSSHSAHAQSFSLPEPTPTPTPLPQGPVDVRSGVPIAPRSIPDAAPSDPAPATTPSQDPAASPTSQQSAGRQEDGQAGGTPSNNPIDLQQPRAPSPLGTQPVTGANRQPAVAEIASGTSASASGTPGPSIEPPAGTESALPGLGNAPDAIVNAPPSIDQQPAPFPQWLWGLIALGLALLAGAFFMRRNRMAKPAASAPLAADLTLQKKAHAPPPPNPPRPASSQPGADPAPPPIHSRMDMEIEIAGATRSFMMFTLDCRITVHNRSDNALRDVAISGACVCAQSAAKSPSNAALAEELETIDRIGPQQSASINAQLQLPLSKVQPLRQGQKPLFIPLVHIATRTGTANPRQRSFVIGLPSAAGTGRLHPIALDTPPGGIHGLKANEVKTDTAKPQAA